MLDPADLPRLARLGVVASMQPIHATSDRYMADRLWGARCRHAYAWRELLDSGAVLAFGSDCPVETLDPLQGIYAAVARKRADEPESAPWYPEQAVTVEEALRAYTVGCAYACGQEGSAGNAAARHGGRRDGAVAGYRALAGRAAAATRGWSTPSSVARWSTRGPSRLSPRGFGAAGSRSLVQTFTFTLDASAVL